MDFNLMAKDDSVVANSQRSHVKLENTASESNNCEPSTVVEANSSNSTSQDFSPSSSFEDELIPGTPQAKRVEDVSKEPFEFKTPSPVRPTMKQSSKQTTPSSKLQTRAESSAHTVKAMSSLKKSPAVKIASFAKASPVDRLAPKTASNNLDTRISRHEFDSGPSSLSSRFISQCSTGSSKQPRSQTSLPTPALNEALRSFFNYANQSEASPSTDTSHSGDEDDDEDDEDVEEEEILVYMQFDSKLDSDLLQPHTPFKIIGVESEKPVLQLGNQVFEGNWSDTVGTAVFFEENASVSPGDPVFMKNPPSTLNYHSKTEKALVMSRIFVKPKAEDEEDAPLVPMAIVEVAP